MNKKADELFKQECFARYERCKQKLDSGNRTMVRNWLDRLSDDERQLCRNVLNTIVKGRQLKAQGASHV